MNYIGIDIGSTAAKVSIFNGEDITKNFCIPTGWSSVETSNIIKQKIDSMGIKDYRVVATGYGRISVPYANKAVTEITCHGVGAYYLNKDDCTVIDIGGQDTKIISVQGGRVVDFTMNDKCAAGTGRFLELMANTLGVTIEDLSSMSSKGSNTVISSMCTVFAESEVVSLIGRGTKREDIAFGVIDSISTKVKSLCSRHSSCNKYFLTGGLCENIYIVDRLSEKLGYRVKTHKLGRYAGSIGAALIAKDIS